RAAAARGLTWGPAAAPETLRLPAGGVQRGPYQLLAQLLRSDGTAPPSDLSSSLDSLRLAAAEALAGSERQVSWTLRLLASPEQALSEVLPEGAARAALVRAMLLLGPQLKESLLAVASGSSPELRRVALLALSRLDWSRVSGLMVRSLDDSARGVRQAALRILRQHDDPPPEAVSRVIATFARSPNWAERLLGARALGVWADVRAVPVLLELLAEDDYAFVREAAARALGRLRRPRVDEALRRAVREDPEPRVRAAAAHALSPAPDAGRGPSAS
ncbi:MAG: HEAT repeat domain-containing protein, partial [Deltaproteobacteria bacterium]|nr:HEAT repeat domain-containing protein [Deltaproteobacteria bacterium]